MLVQFLIIGTNTMPTIYSPCALEVTNIIYKYDLNLESNISTPWVGATPMILINFDIMAVPWHSPMERYITYKIFEYWHKGEESE